MRRSRIAAALCAGILLSCLTTDFEPVQPGTIAISNVKCINRDQRPNVMLLVDKSGSMMTTINPSCSGGGCPTRLSELQSAMDTFLTSFADKARMGLTLFPQGSGCALTTSTTVNIPQADDQTVATAAQIRSVINSTSASGGTPTADAVRFAAQNPALHDSTRENYIVLLTDGLPNCNYALDGATCTCTSSSVGSCSASSSSQCLNDDDTVAAIREAFLAYGIKTVVVGFGSDVANPLGQTTLQAMAMAGAYQRVCSQNSDCGGSTCDLVTGTCAQAYCDAQTSLELGQALTQFVYGLNVCRIDLTATPSDPALVSVVVDGVAYSSGATTWQYHAPLPGTGLGYVELVSDLCALAKSGTPSHPVTVQVQSVQRF